MLNKLRNSLPSGSVFLGLLGLFATLGSGILGIVATVAEDKLEEVTITISALGITGFVVGFLVMARLGRPWKIIDAPYSTKSTTLHWDISAQDGSVAFLTKAKSIIFTQNNNESLRDVVRSDGKPPQTSDFEVNAEGCQPSIVQLRQDGPYWHLLIALNATFNRGDELNWTLRQKLNDAFLNPKSEYVAGTVPVKTGEIELKVTLPDSRSIVRGSANVVKQKAGSASSPFTLDWDKDVKNDPQSGRQYLQWTQKNPETNVRYVLSWNW